MQPDDWIALGLTVRLAAITTALLLIVSLPLAWWLARGQSKFRTAVEAIIALPLVLPPTVLGFYLLLLLGQSGPLAAAGLPATAFSFGGLVIGSMLYSLPFVVQPLRDAFLGVGKQTLEMAATLGAGGLDRFRNVVLPLSRPGLLTAIVLGFAHTVGEFGVVLMIGGSIPGETRVLSIAIYEHVEALDYARAHWIAGLLLTVSFLLLLVVYGTRRSGRFRF